MISTVALAEQIHNYGYKLELYQFDYCSTCTASAKVLEKSRFENKYDSFECFKNNVNHELKYDNMNNVYSHIINYLDQCQELNKFSVIEIIVCGKFVTHIKNSQVNKGIKLVFSINTLDRHDLILPGYTKNQTYAIEAFVLVGGISILYGGFKLLKHIFS